MMASLFTLENIYRAYHDCRRSKRNKKSALVFETNAEEQLIRLVRELESRIYRPSPSFCFVSRNDKYREIFAADFRDRIVHHLLVRHLERIWEPVFIYDSFASRKGKGTHGAVKRLQMFLGKLTSNRTRRAFYAQLDIKAFFPSIDRRILLNQVLSRLDNEELQWLAEVIILHDPIKDARFSCTPAKWRHVPASKSLFSVPPGKGLPIGNITSQFFANVYLNSLDYFVKHNLRAKFYIRYVDDMVLLNGQREKLKEWTNRIGNFLKSELELVLHPGREKIGPVSNGIDFLGYINKPTHRFVRNRVATRCKTNIQRQSRIMTRKYGDMVAVNCEPQKYQKLQATFSSYLGIFSHGSCRRLIESVFRKNPLIFFLFDPKENRLKKRWFPPFKPANFYTQYRYFRNLFPGILWVQIGTYFECFDEDAKWVAKSLGLKPIRPRKRFYYRCGVPVHNIIKIMEGLRGAPMLFVTETGRLFPKIKERAGTMFLLPGTGFF